MSGILQLPSVVEVTALRAAFPAYMFNVIVEGGNRKYEAVRRRDAIGPIYCLISVSAREIYMELSRSPGIATSLHAQ